MALLSKYPIIKSEALYVKHSKIKRPILKTTLLIEKKTLIVFNNHWPSKRQAENERILFSQRLQTELKKLSKKQDYIILGDLNSNYNENETFKYDKKLNNTYNLTGINDVLKTSTEYSFTKKIDLLDSNQFLHYNLWQELSYLERFSYKFKGSNATPDNIIIPSALFDTYGISYIDKSFGVFKPKYLYENNHVKRWSIKKGIHQNHGYSDHLPIYANFSTNKTDKPKAKKINHLLELYKTNEYHLPIELSNIIVTYKHKDLAIIKELNGRALFIYKGANTLKKGFLYRLKVNQLSLYHGLLETNSIEIVEKKPTKIDASTLHLEAKNIKLHDLSLQNEIIKNLQAQYKKGYLHYNEQGKKKKIKLYSKNKKLLPKSGKKVTIITGHLGFYKSKPQIIIYKKSDIK